MPKAALLRVSDAGVVLAANEVAEQWLGRCVGQPCCELVAAADPDGAVHCSERCASRLHRTGGTTGLDAATVHSRPAGLTCAALGDEVVVALQPTAEPQGVPLSEREREVLGLVAQGFTNRRVAQRLSLAMSTVRTHMERILDKLGVRSRAAAVHRAIATGQLPPPAT